MDAQEKRIREFVKERYHIDEHRLSYDDVKKLANFYLVVMDMETPMMANAERNRLWPTNKS